MSTPTPARVPPNFPGRRVPLGPRMSRRSGGALAVGLATLGALAHRVGAKDSSHTMASVADGASVIKATTHSQGALWVKVPAARVAEDSPCKAQDCYAVCATLPADVRGEILPSTQCERGWDQPKGLGGYPVATSKAPPPPSKERPSRAGRVLAVPLRMRLGWYRRLVRPPSRTRAAWRHSRWSAPPPAPAH